MKIIIAGKRILVQDEETGNVTQIQQSDIQILDPNSGNLSSIEDVFMLCIATSGYESKLRTILPQDLSLLSHAAEFIQIYLSSIYSEKLDSSQIQ